MKKFGLSLLILFCLVSFVIPIYALSALQSQNITLNDRVVAPPVPLITVNDETLIPLGWFATTMGASSVNWDADTQTVTVVVDDFLKRHQYLSYLNGLEDDGDDYPLPSRLQHLELPPYPLHSNQPPSLNPSSITLNIVSGDFVMPWAVYDYLIKDGTLYVGVDWLNTLFLAQIEAKPDTLSITYPTTTLLNQEIASLEKIIMPISPEEALALWIGGQQRRSGALQYIALSPTLKEVALTHIASNGWVTAGSSPSLGMATIEPLPSINATSYTYEISFDEIAGGEVIGNIQQRITIQKYSMDGQDYSLISDVSGDVDYYSVLQNLTS